MARPRLDPDTDSPRRLNIVAPADWVARIDAWRRQQPEIPNLSEAIRQLVDEALATKRKRK